MSIKAHIHQTDPIWSQMRKFLSTSSSKAHTSRDHCFRYFLSPDFHEMWRSMISTHPINEVKHQWAMLVLGWATVGFHGLVWNVSDSDVFVFVARLP